MSTYKEIKGFKVQTLASDTAASVASTGSWASGGNRPAGVQAGTGFGSGSTSGLAATGNLYPPNTITVDVQTYDGSSCSAALRLDGDNTATFAGAVIIPNLPTSDPGVTGQLWNDSGTLKIA